MSALFAWALLALFAQVDGDEADHNHVKTDFLASLAPESTERLEERLFLVLILGNLLNIHGVKHTFRSVHVDLEK